jgi:hypothetical protein
MGDTLNDTVPATPGWHWKQTHHDNFEVTGPEEEMRKYRGAAYVKSLDGTRPFSFRTYLAMCWWCGGAHINPSRS